MLQKYITFQLELSCRLVAEKYAAKYKHLYIKVIIPALPYGNFLLSLNYKTYYLREMPGAFTPPVDDDAVEFQRYATDERYNHPVTFG